MGTWDVGPFDNDTAADWCGDLDDTSPDARRILVRDARPSGRHRTGLPLRERRRRSRRGSGPGRRAKPRRRARPTPTTDRTSRSPTSPVCAPSPSRPSTAS